MVRLFFIFFYKIPKKLKNVDTRKIERNWSLAMFVQYFCWFASVNFVVLIGHVFRTYTTCNLNIFGFWYCSFSDNNK